MRIPSSAEYLRHLKRLANDDDETFVGNSDDGEFGFPQIVSDPGCRNTREAKADIIRQFNRRYPAVERFFYNIRFPLTLLRCMMLDEKQPDLGLDRKRFGVCWTLHDEVGMRGMSICDQATHAFRGVVNSEDDVDLMASIARQLDDGYGIGSGNDEFEITLKRGALVEVTEFAELPVRGAAVPRLKWEPLGYTVIA